MGSCHTHSIAARAVGRRSRAVRATTQMVPSLRDSGVFCMSLIALFLASLDEMGSRIDELEKSIGELMTQVRPMHEPSAPTVRWRSPSWCIVHDPQAGVEDDGGAGEH